VEKYCRYLIIIKITTNKLELIELSQEFLESNILKTINKLTTASVH